MSNHSRCNAILTALALLLTCVSSHADSQSQTIPTQAEDQGKARDGLSEESINSELGLFQSVEVSLRQALTLARQLHGGTRIVDISFDGESGVPLYRAYRGKLFWEDAIDARTGNVIDRAIETP